MLFLYNLGIKVYNFLLFLLQFFNPKAKLWIEGRKGFFKKVSSLPAADTKRIWFHFASLGEFEQGRPVLEQIKKQYPGHPVVMTFFSPSGYELRKNSPLADHVFYLPIDTKENAEKFIRLINPKLVIFTKYEYWYHYFNELNKRHVPLYIISAIFRKNQPFFKWYGGLHRKMLGFVSHFFVQDPFSSELLKEINIRNVTISGDTRFDRVAENAKSPKQFNEVKSFCGNSKVFVAGSTWPEDESLIAGLVKSYPGWKFILAPHEIKPEKIKALEEMLPEGTTTRYSALSARNLNPSVSPPQPATPGLQPSTHNPQPIISPTLQPATRNPQLLIIDNIGMLSSLYQYGEIAYIGGGFGVGIHNTLEAAAFGIPVIFGPNYHKFLEAKALIQNGGGFSISNEKELQEIMIKLMDEGYRTRAGNAAGNFVEDQKGATGIILSFLEKQDHPVS